MKKNPLTDVLSARARRVLYAVLFVLALAFAAWKAAHGDWTEFAGGLVTALFNATAASNVEVPPREKTVMGEHRAAH